MPRIQLRPRSDRKAVVTMLGRIIYREFTIGKFLSLPGYFVWREGTVVSHDCRSVEHAKALVDSLLD